MIKPKRLRHASFSSPDPSRLAEYYASVIGLGVIAREAGSVYLASESEQLSMVISKGEAALARIAFEVAADADFVAMRAALAEAGIAAEIRSDPLPGIASVLAYSDREGTEFELVSGWSPSPSQERIAGLAVTKLGHLALTTRDPLAASTFCADVMGFRVSDWIEDRFVFMRCGYEHHTLNFALGPERRLHHIAFELRDAAHMHRACDLLARNEHPVLWGPVRHGPGHNIAIYHRNPDGHLVELFYDMDRMTDEELGYYDPRPWHRDRPQRPKVWVGLPRDVWGTPPTPACTEFFR
jgi:catechol-2,3-dioxygenase